MQLLMFTKMLAELDVRQLGETMTDLGFNGMDLAIRPGHPVNPDNVETALPEAVKLWSDMGLAVGMVTTDTSLIDPTSPDAERVFAAVGGAGVRYIKLGYYLWKPGEDYWEQVKIIRTRLDGFAELGARHGVMPCYHTHSGHFYGANASGLMHLLEGMDPERIGAYIDTAHLLLDGESFTMAMSIVDPYLKIVAIKDPLYVEGGRKIVPLGEGLVDFVDVCRDLKAVDFSGPVSLHSEYDLDAQAVITTTRQDLHRFRSWMAEAGW